MKNLGRPDFMLQEKCRSYEPTRIRKENRKRDPNKVKQEEMTPEKDKSFFEETRTPRTVLILGGEDVISLLHTPK